MMSKKLWALILFLSPLGVRAWAQDAPDLSKERRFHQMYLKYGEKPTSPEKWSQAIAGHEPTYLITKGDTLWDVSETFFGDPEFWPKIWALNQTGIFNPHEIDPGDNIQFVPGTLNDPPSFSIVSGPVEAMPVVEEKPDDKTPAVLVKPVTHEYMEIDLNSLAIPPPRKKVSKPSQPPMSFPPWKVRTDVNQAIVIESNPIRRELGANEFLIYQYVVANEPEAKGEVIEAEFASPLAHEGQSIVIESEAAKPGQRFSVYRVLGKLKSESTSSKGWIISIDGEIEVQEVVNAKRNLSRAKILWANFPVEVGNELSSLMSLRAQAADAGQGTDATGSVIGGPYSEDRDLFGLGQVVFLEGTGLGMGQVLNVYRNEQVRNPDSKQMQSFKRIGLIRVVRTDGAFVTGVVIRAEEDIRTGDLFRPRIEDN